MIIVKRTNIYRLVDYSKHLKALPDHDKKSRFGYLVQTHTIDQLILRMVYEPSSHELWYAKCDGKLVGWGHLADNDNGTWELAVSVDSAYQRKGIGDKLILAMLEWAKFHKVSEIYMQCIEENHVIQHLARKHNLKTKERLCGEQIANIELPNPTILETNIELWREQTEIFTEFNRLRDRLLDLWMIPMRSKES